MHLLLEWDLGCWEVFYCVPVGFWDSYYGVYFDCGAGDFVGAGSSSSYVKLFEPACDY